VERGAPKSELPGFKESIYLSTPLPLFSACVTQPRARDTVTEVQSQRIRFLQVRRRRKVERTTPQAGKGSCKQRHRLYAQRNEPHITQFAYKSQLAGAMRSRGLGRSMTSVEKRRGKVGSAAPNSICLTFMYRNRLSHCLFAEVERLFL
jgi:hypothetical protein